MNQSEISPPPASRNIVALLELRSAFVARDNVSLVTRLWTLKHAALG